MRLPDSLDLDFTNRLADPFGSLGLGGAKEDFSRWLGQHGLGVLTVAGLHLAASLESKAHRILRFPVLGNGRVKLREALEAGQLVDYEPDRLLIRHRFI